MRKVKIIVDSVCDILIYDNEESLSKFDIDYVPLYVHFEQEMYKDFKEIRPKELFKKVEECGKLPLTCCPSPDDYRHVINKYIENDYDVVFFSIGKELSGGYKACLLGSEEFGEDRVYVIDSQNLSSGIGILVLKALKLRDEGKSAKEIYEYIESIKNKSRCKFVVNTMSYLHKGGRCGTIALLIGSMVALKPIIKVENGKMQVHQRPIGIKRALKALINDFNEDFSKGNVDLDTVLITHCEIPENVEVIRKGLIELGVDPSIIHTSEANCTVATHCGPECIGIIYLTK